MSVTKLSVFLSYLLRHKPEEIGLDMDKHGWVDVSKLIEKINTRSKYTLTNETLKDIVNMDNKGRYRFSDDGKKIKACQGHSISWVEPELRYTTPPDYLYHGTTFQAYQKIMASGSIQKMSRHAVHMQADVGKAWQSANRWRQVPVVLKIDAKHMAEDGYIFGVSDNAVWCSEIIPVQYIIECLHNT